MTRAPLPSLLLYTRAGCALCDEARALLGALLAERIEAGLPAPAIEERDIEADPEWQHAYFATIPVVEIAGRRLEIATSAAKLRRLLGDALDARDAPDALDAPFVAGA